MGVAGDRIPSGTLGGGAWHLVVITPSNGTTDIKLGICSDFSYDEDFQVNPAEVIGYLGPIAYDSQGYSCRISLGTYVQRASDRTALPGGSIGDVNILFPRRQDIIRTGKLTDNEITLVDIFDGSILNNFVGCILATNGVQVRPNSYITRQATYLATERRI